MIPNAAILKPDHLHSSSVEEDGDESRCIPRLLIFLTVVIIAAAVWLLCGIPLYLFGYLLILLYMIEAFDSRDATLDGISIHILLGFTSFVAIFTVNALLLGAFTLMVVYIFDPSIYHGETIGSLITFSWFCFFSVSCGFTSSIGVAILSKHMLNWNLDYLNRNSLFIYGTAIGVGEAIGFAPLFIFANNYAVSQVYIFAIVSLLIASCSYILLMSADARFPVLGSAEDIKGGTHIVKLICFPGFILSAFTVCVTASDVIIDTFVQPHISSTLHLVIAGVVGSWGLMATLYWFWLGNQCKLRVTAEIAQFGENITHRSSKMQNADAYLPVMSL